MIPRISLALLLLLTSPCLVAANAADAAVSGQALGWVDPGWRRTVSRYTVSFDEQGLSTTIVDYEIQALDEKGAAAISQQTFAYNSYFNELISSDLATLKADGGVIPVDEHAIRDQPASADTSSPYFDERRNRIIAYSSVAAGDRIRGHLVYKATRPVFSGEFARYWSQPADQPPEVTELTIEGPASKPLHIALRDAEHREEKIGDRIVHHVRLRQQTPKPRLIDADTFDEARRFEVSTFADYPAFAAMLNARNAPMAAPDEKLRKLASEIVGDAADPRAKVERIYNWVARNIRYVGIGFEDGGWTSQPASAVLASRYGDCKAHATILKALLAAQGIEADLVAVNAQAQYTLTRVATPNFDHAIVYVPAIDQYLDPTASLLAFGALPPNLGGKPALNIDRGTVANIPVAPPERFTLAADTAYTLASDGTREAHSMLSGTGVGALIGRAIAQHLERADRSDVAKKSIEHAGLNGTGDYSFANPRELSDSYAITSTFQISKRLDLAEPAEVRMLPLTDLRGPLLPLVTGGATERPFPCRSLEYRETASLTVPEGTFIYEKPAPISYTANLKGETLYGAAHGSIEVSGRAVLEGRTLRSTALFRVTLDAAVCPAEFAAAIKIGADKFSGFKYGAIGLTPKSAPYVTEMSPGFTEGVNAYLGHRYKVAMTELKPFAENGSARAQSYIASMYEGGRGVERDYAEAIRWFLMAGEQGDAYSQSHLGYLYEVGLGAERDEKRAAQWYAKAADQGEVYGEARLGGMYRDGRGLPQDFAQAANWFSKAADQDSSWAQMNLGLLYLKGEGVPRDDVKAMSLLHKAADQNDSYAQYNLGWAYESGTGVAKDTQEAIKWYAKASERGNDQASARLSGLTAGNGFWRILLRCIAVFSWS